MRTADPDIPRTKPERAQIEHEITSWNGINLVVSVASLLKMLPALHMQTGENTAKTTDVTLGWEEKTSNGQLGLITALLITTNYANKIPIGCLLPPQLPLLLR